MLRRGDRRHRGRHGAGARADVGDDAHRLEPVGRAGVPGEQPRHRCDLVALAGQARVHRLEPRRGLGARGLVRGEPVAAEAVERHHEASRGVAVEPRRDLRRRRPDRAEGGLRRPARAGREGARAQPRQRDQHERGRGGRGCHREQREALTHRGCGGPDERREQRAQIGPAPRRVRIEPALEHAAHAARQVGGRRRSRADRPAKLVDRTAGERPRAGERLPRRDAERELIRARVRRATVELLRRHVCRRADQRPGAGQARRRQRVAAAERLQRVVERHRRIGGDAARARRRAGTAVLRHVAREPEVGVHDPPVALAQHVVRLEVAVHQPRGVGGGEPAAGGE